MKQILDIFKKEVRRHWPEILISITFLALFAQLELKGPSNPVYGPTFLWFLRLAAVRPLMIIFWIFLTVRIVQGESLVGDRQWWVTKPYEWWKLLAAKELFLVVFIGVPFFFVQLFLLLHSGFPILRNFIGVLGTQFALGLVLFLPSVALGSLTKGLGQALIGILVAFFAVWAVLAGMEKIPSIDMSSAVGGLEEITGLLAIGSIIGSASWQYARRKTWAARGLLLGGCALIVLISALTPYARFVERNYPLIEDSDAPAHFVVGILKPHLKKQNARLDSEPNVYFRIPLLVSGIADKHVVILEGTKATMGTPSGAILDHGWKSQWTRMWKEDQEETILFELGRKEFEELKKVTVKLHLELALAEYQETEARELVLKEGEFGDTKFGICNISEKSSFQVECRRPFHQPGFMATFDPAGQTCPWKSEDNSLPEEKVTHDWFPPGGEESLNPELNPVTNYQLTFESRYQLRLPGSDREAKTVRLCPGTRIRIAEPKEVRSVRVKLVVENVHVSDLVGPQYDWQ